MAEDVHDLFDSEEADESDGSADGLKERSDESDGSVEWDEPPWLEDETSPADSVREEPPRSSVSSGKTPEDGLGEFESAVSTTSSAGSVDDGPGESDSAAPTTPAVNSTEETGGSEPTESTRTPLGGAIEDDTGEFDDADGFESTESATTPAGGTVRDDTEEFDDTGEFDGLGEFETPEPTTTSDEGAILDDSAESGSTAAAIPPEGTTAEERDESESDGVAASVDGTAQDDRGHSEPGRVTTSTDGPTAADHEELETAGPSESGPTVSRAAVDDGVAKPASGSSRLPTGIDVLDRAMGGGVPPGRLVVLVADPGVQSQLIVDSVLSQRDTLFVTTDRPDWEVMKDIEPGLGSGEVKIREHTPDSLLLGLDSLMDELGTSSNFVLDSVNELELVPRERYRSFLSDVKRRLFDTGSWGLLTGVTVEHESARDLTLRRADVVWRLETRTTDREIENRLTVPKFRGGAAMTETVKLELTDEVRVDPRWNEE